MSTPHVVVVGGGFGGLATVQGLARADVRITLVDRRNHHLFQPLLYQVATAGLAPSDIAEPLRGILGRQRNVEVIQGEVVDVDVHGRTIALRQGRRLDYDHLVLAAGAVSSYFGHDDWEARAPGLKTISDALEIRHRMLGAFERAEWTEDPDLRRRLLTFVVVGAGPTGVEMAGAIREIACHTLAADFHHVDLTQVRVVLVEGQTVLPPFPPSLQDAARAQLEGLGVEVRTGVLVKEVGDGFVRFGDDEVVEAAHVIWGAGVRAAPIADRLGVDQDRGGRVPVSQDLSLPDHPEVRVIGDMAKVAWGDDGEVPGVAPAAIDMGAHVARTIRADLAGHARKPFRYLHKGSLATIGRSRAVADLPFGLRFSGSVAWLMWVFVHLMTLVGHRNRLVVFTKWAWAWASYDRSSRLLWRDEAELLVQGMSDRPARSGGEPRPATDP